MYSRSIFSVIIFLHTIAYSMEPDNTGSLILELLLRHIVPMDHHAICAIAGASKRVHALVISTAPERKQWLTDFVSRWDSGFDVRAMLTMHKYGSACGFVSARFLWSGPYSDNDASTDDSEYALELYNVAMSNDKNCISSNCMIAQVVGSPINKDKIRYRTEEFKAQNKAVEYYSITVHQPFFIAANTVAVTVDSKYEKQSREVSTRLEIKKHS